MYIKKGENYFNDIAFEINYMLKKIFDYKSIFEIKLYY